jgi:hypothetical protein
MVTFKDVVMVIPDPRESSCHTNEDTDNGDGTRCKGSRGLILAIDKDGDEVVDEPNSTGYGTSRMDTAEMLESGSASETNDERRPLEDVS